MLVCIQQTIQQTWPVPYDTVICQFCEVRPVEKVHPLHASAVPPQNLGYGDQLGRGHPLRQLVARGIVCLLTVGDILTASTWLGSGLIPCPPSNITTIGQSRLALDTFRALDLQFALQQVKTQCPGAWQVHLQFPYIPSLCTVQDLPVSMKAIKQTHMLSFSCGL